MKAMDLLKSLNAVDPAYVAEASDRNLLLYRKRKKRTRMAVAACLAGVVLAGVFMVKPALYAWETRNTVVSWRDNGGFVYLEFDKPSASVFVSAEMPAQKKFAAEAPFTLSVGMGQASDYAYATLSVKAEGFEITDKDGNTVTDRYVRTLSDFNSGDYGMVYRDGKRTSPITGCSHLEDFTLRYVGGENAAGWGVIEFSLTSRGQSSTMGDAVAVYYTVQNGVLKLTDKRPADGGLRGELAEETEDGTVSLSAEDIAVNVRMDTAVFTPFQYFGDCLEITAHYKTNRTEYATDRFTAELVYAESLREKDYSFFLKKPAAYTEDGHTVVMVPRVPVDAPVGSYDLRITDPETGFVWVITDRAWVLPELPDGSGIPAYGDFVCEAEEVTHTPKQGDSEWGFGELFTLTEKGKDVSFICRAHLEYAGDTGEDYTVVLAESGVSSSLGAVLSFVPADAPAGPYDLVITHGIYGYTWRFENYVEVAENPHARSFGLYHSMGQRLTVRRSAEMEYTFVAKVENRGKPFTLTVTEDERFMPQAALTAIIHTDSSDTAPAYPIYSPSGKFEACSIALQPLREPVTEPYGQTVTTGQTGSCTYRILVTPDTPCGIYDLTLSYGDSKVVFRGVVEVVP